MQKFTFEVQKACLAKKHTNSITLLGRFLKKLATALSTKADADGLST